MHASKPPVVASEGANRVQNFSVRIRAFSARQNATSSPITATHVPPRAVRNEAGRTSISTFVESAIVSLVSFSTSSLKAATFSNMPFKY